MAPASPSKTALVFGLNLTGGLVLAAAGLYGLLVQNTGGALPAAALIALGLAGVARSAASRSGGRSAERAGLLLIGCAAGLLAAGWVG